MNIRPHRTLGPGRYVLDIHGRLHPLRRRYHVVGVAVVHVKPLKSNDCMPREFPTADDASGCDGRAAAREPAKVILSREPDVPIRPAASGDSSPPGMTPVNARQSRTKIDLSTVPSSMELTAASWRKG